MRFTKAQLLFALILISREDGRVYWTNQTAKCSKIKAIAALLSALHWKLFRGPHSFDEDRDKDGNHSVQNSERKPTSAMGSQGSHLIHTSHLHLLNPLPSMSDQERISSYNIISILSIEVMRISQYHNITLELTIKVKKITVMIANKKCSWSLKKFSLPAP